MKMISFGMKISIKDKFIKKLNSAIRKIAPHENLMRVDDLNVLYATSLWHSEELKPYAVSENKKFQALEHRFNFALGYLSNPEFSYKQTSYYDYLSQQAKVNHSGVWEGNLNYRYVDSEIMCMRYMALIDTLKNEPDHEKISRGEMIAYIRAQYPRIYNFEKKFQRKIRYASSLKSEKKKNEYGLLNRLLNIALPRFAADNFLIHTFRTNSGLIIVGNGAHRLSAYKALNHLGMRSEKLYVRRPSNGLH